jgi:lipoprotein-releasing system ATP-binding protein
MSPFVEVTGLVKAYVAPGGRLEVLQGLDLTIAQGEMVAIVGASGVGKSTLLHVLGGLDSFEGGTVRIGDARIDQMRPDERVAFRNRHVGFVFQFHHLLPEFTALENVEMPLFIGGVAADERRRRAGAVLERVGLSGRADHRPGMLSGGEQQRVAVARALVASPSIFLADEPTGNLDEATAGELHALLRDTHLESRLTSVIVTHNPTLAALCDRALVLEGGRLRDRPDGRPGPDSGVHTSSPPDTSRAV